jgi:hypothetical protein
MHLLGGHAKVLWTDDQQNAWNSFVKAMKAAESNQSDTPDLCKLFLVNFLLAFSDGDVTLSIHVFCSHVPFFVQKYGGIQRHCQQGAEHRIQALQTDFLFRTSRRAGEFLQPNKAVVISEDGSTQNDQETFGLSKIGNFSFNFNLILSA